MRHQYVKVDNQLVHQVSLEDVLLCNGYIGLPTAIKKNLFDNELAKKLNENELDVFHSLYESYIPKTCNKGIFHENKYVLKSIFPEISKDLIKNYSVEGNKALINNYIEYSDRYILNNEFVDEHNEKLLLKLMGRNDLVISELERAKLSNFLEENSFILINKVYYATMFNDTHHPYYYKKDHEHVPGMMVIESVRQALYAYTYKFKKCKRGNVSISISTLNNNFYHYAQSNYPLKIMVEDNAEADDDENRDLKLRAKLFQRNCLIAEIFYVGSMMKLNSFKRMRLMGKDEEEYMFYPLRNMNEMLILIDENYDCVYTAQLKEISMKGMHLFISSKDVFEINKKFKLILGVKNNNTNIILSCTLELKKDAVDGSYVYIRFVNLSKDSIMKISDYIKNYTYINDKGLII